MIQHAKGSTKSQIIIIIMSLLAYKRNVAIFLYKSDDSVQSNNQMELVASKKLTEDQVGKKLYLEIEANGNTYSFSYTFEPNQWNLLKDSVDAKYLSTRIAGGFECQGNDEVYKKSNKKNNY